MFVKFDGRLGCTSKLGIETSFWLARHRMLVPPFFVLCVVGTITKICLCLEIRLPSSSKSFSVPFVQEDKGDGDHQDRDKGRRKKRKDPDTETEETGRSIT